MKQVKSVDEYIAAAPKEAQLKLKEIRAAIKEVASDASESISYGMPFYSYKGEEGFRGRLIYFGLLKSGIGLYMRPQDLDQHLNDLAEYKSTKSALKFPLDQPVPVSLIKKLVREAMKTHHALNRTRIKERGNRVKSSRVVERGSQRSHLINQRGFC